MKLARFISRNSRAILIAAVILAVPAAIGNEVAWAKQEPQLGTGHAVQQAMPQLQQNGVVLVLYGDVPLMRAETLRPLTELARQGSLAILTAVAARRSAPAATSRNDPAHHV